MIKYFLFLCVFFSFQKELFQKLFIVFHVKNMILLMSTFCKLNYTFYCDFMMDFCIVDVRYCLNAFNRILLIEQKENFYRKTSNLRSSFWRELEKIFCLNKVLNGRRNAIDWWKKFGNFFMIALVLGIALRGCN